MRSSRRFAAVTLACASIIVIAAGCGCGGTSSTRGTNAGAAREVGPQGKDGVAPQPAQDGPAGKPDAGVPAQAVVDSRALIFTGTAPRRG
jgi:hypothetical protein